MSRSSVPVKPDYASNFVATSPFRHTLTAFRQLNPFNSHLTEPLYRFDSSIVSPFLRATTAICGRRYTRFESQVEQCEDISVPQLRSSPHLITYVIQYQLKIICTKELCKDYKDITGHDLNVEIGHPFKLWQLITIPSEILNYFLIHREDAKDRYSLAYKFMDLYNQFTFSLFKSTLTLLHPSHCDEYLSRLFPKQSLKDLLVKENKYDDLYQQCNDADKLANQTEFNHLSGLINFDRIDEKIKDMGKIDQEGELYHNKDKRKLGKELSSTIIRGASQPKLAQSQTRNEKKSPGSYGVATIQTPVRSSNAKNKNIDIMDDFVTPGKKTKTPKPTNTKTEKQPTTSTTKPTSATKAPKTTKTTKKAIAIIDEPDEDFENFEVEKIIGAKLEGKKLLFHIKWLNYPPSANTWEPASNLSDQSKIEAKILLEEKFPALLKHWKS
jgi:hypothetical protein